MFTGRSRTRLILLSLPVVSYPKIRQVMVPIVVGALLPMHLFASAFRSAVVGPPRIRMRQQLWPLKAAPPRVVLCCHYALRNGLPSLHFVTLRPTHENGRLGLAN